ARIRAQRIDKVINTAKGYIGTPYKWGGTSRSGIDCSGLLCNSFRIANYNLPRTSDAQSKIGKKVKKNKLQPGDLVFFATGKKRRKVTHVGLVTEVKGGKVKFIHSSSSLGVVISDMDVKYYRKRFRMGRRPF
ncbi:NlpC/P60 family protein, partial [Fulvivirga sp. RKSG066]|uniref:C40 family peptidase n=1 Tax=Fulvivirga aurantia TaxID=2529383 RepID=UPI0012BC8311